MNWRAELDRRPWWMNVMFAVCVLVTFVYFPYDVFFVPLEKAEDVWLGVTLKGGWAKVGEVAHWIVYATGAYGFWKMRSWMWPWAAVWMLQVGVAHLFWSELSPRGGGFLRGLWQFALFLIPVWLLYRSRERFERA